MYKTKLKTEIDKWLETEKKMLAAASKYFIITIKSNGR